MNLAVNLDRQVFTIFLGEGEMAKKICQCGSEYFCVSKVEEKGKAEVRCVLCGSFYGCVIPVFKSNYENCWALVNHN
jgi:hypothetical protein